MNTKPRDDALTTLGFASGMNPDAAALKARWQSLVKECHPDLSGGDRKRFDAVNAAYEWLKNPPLEASVRARLERELKALRQNLVNVDATVVTWRPDDPRIPKMRDPILAKIAEHERELRRP